MSAQTAPAGGVMSGVGTVGPVAATTLHSGTGTTTNTLLSSVAPTSKAPAVTGLPSSHSPVITSTSSAPPVKPVVPSSVSSVKPSPLPSTSSAHLPSVAPTTQPPISTTPLPSPSPTAPQDRVPFSEQPVPSELVEDSGGVQVKLPVLVGIIAGGVVLVLLIGAGYFALLRRRRRAHRREMEDDALGGGDLDWRKSSRLSRLGYERSEDPMYDAHDVPNGNMASLAVPSYNQRRPHDLTRAEAHASVQLAYPPHAGPSRSDLFLPPTRTHPAFGYAEQRNRASASTAWTDNSEMDMYAVRGDGSTIARTMSTVSRPNSEYDLENDPGATAYHSYPAPTPVGTYHSHASGATFGPFSPPPQQPAHIMAAHSTLSPPGTYHSAAAGTGTGTYPSLPAGPYDSEPLAGLAAQTSSFTPVHPHPPAPVATSSAAVPASRQQQRIPAPRLLVDTKAPIWPDDTHASSVTSPPSAGPSYWALQSTASLVQPNTSVPSPETFGGQSAARTLVQPTRQSMPYGGIVSADPSPAPTPTATAPPAGASLTRGPTIVRHADAGVAFEDAVPDGDANGELHLPPAYGDIYGPPEPAPSTSR